MKTILTLIAVIFTSALLSSCSSTESNTYGYEELNKIWVLQNLHGTQATTANWPNGLPWMELKVNKGEFGGNTGCNGMGGTVNATKNMIIFSNIIATRMFCDDVDETGFLNALHSSRYWSIENERLFLYDAPGGVVIAVFKEGTVPDTEPQ